MLKDLQKVEHNQHAVDVHPYLLPSVICCWIHTQMKEIKTWETLFPISPVNGLSSRTHCCGKNKYFLYSLNMKDKIKNSITLATVHMSSTQLKLMITKENNIICGSKLSDFSEFSTEQYKSICRMHSMSSWLVPQLSFCITNRNIIITIHSHSKEAKEHWWLGDWYTPLSTCFFHTRILAVQYSPESSRTI